VHGRDGDVGMCVVVVGMPTYSDSMKSMNALILTCSQTRWRPHNVYWTYGAIVRAYIIFTTAGEVNRHARLGRAPRRDSTVARLSGRPDQQNDVDRSRAMFCVQRYVPNLAAAWRIATAGKVLSVFIIDFSDLNHSVVSPTGAETVVMFAEGKPSFDDFDHFLGLSLFCA